VKFTWSLMLQVMVSPGPGVEARVKDATGLPSPLMARPVLSSLERPLMLSTLTRTTVRVAR
jgi:hypothetical protein